MVQAGMMQWDLGERTRPACRRRRRVVGFVQPFSLHCLEKQFVHESLRRDAANDTPEAVLPILNRIRSG